MRQEDRQEPAFRVATCACLGRGKALFLERGSIDAFGADLHLLLLRRRAWCRRLDRLERRFQVTLGKPGDGRQARHHERAAQAGHLAEAELHQPCQHRLDALLLRAQAVGGTEVLAEAAHEVAQRVLALGKRLVEAGAATFLAQEFVRIQFIGQRADAHVDRLGEEHLDGAVRGLLPGSVAVEEEHDALRKALQDARVLTGERGAERCHHVGHAGGVAGDDIGVALADDGRARVDDRLLGEVDAVQSAALVEHAAFGGIQVLRLVFRIDLPGAEGDRLAHLVADREDHAVAEAVDGALPAVADQAGRAEGVELRHGIVAARTRAVRAQAIDVSHEAVPAIRRGAQLESLAHLRADPAPLERGIGGGAGLGMRQGLAEGVGGDGIRAEQGAAVAGGAVLASRLLKLDACALGQCAQCVDELHLVVVHHEVDGVPGGATAEALVEARALVRHHGHGRGAVVVERTDAHVLAALGPQLHVFADERHHVGGVEHAIPV